MVRAMRDDTGGGRDLSMRARVVLFAVALAACQQDATFDPVVGPSELALSLTLSARPDVLPLDGASQSRVTIHAREFLDGVLVDASEKALRLQIWVGGVPQDYGQISARTLVTRQDGRAVATYTAPLSLSSVDALTQVEIRVTPVGDNYGSAVARTLVIRLVPSGTVSSIAAPVPAFTFSPASPKIGFNIFFDASGSTAVAGIASYDWTFGEGSTASGVTATHFYDRAGAFTVTLTVTDSLGVSASKTSNVSVTSSPPTASFVFSPDAPTTSSLVQFNAVDSSASSGRTIVTYAWNFGDGTLPPVDTTSGVNVAHTFLTAGVYNVTLTVTDSDGETGFATAAVTVVP